MEAVLKFERSAKILFLQEIVQNLPFKLSPVVNGRMGYEDSILTTGLSSWGLLPITPFLQYVRLSKANNYCQLFSEEQDAFDGLVCMKMWLCNFYG